MPRSRAILLSPPFTPKAIPSLKLWLAADKITGLANNDPVASWNDLAGSTLAVAQGTSTKRPLFVTAALHGRPVVRFDGVDDSLFVSSDLGLSGEDKAFSVFVVANLTDAATLRSYVQWGNTGLANPSIDLRTNTTTAILSSNRKDDAGTAVAPTSNPNLAPGLGTGHVLGAVCTGTAIVHSLDGVASNPASQDVGVLTVNQFSVGCRMLNSARTAFWKGDIAEVIAYGLALSSSDRRRVERYLGAKYGIAMS